LKVPIPEPLYVTVTLPAPPAVRFNEAGDTLKPSPEAVQVTTAGPPVAVKLQAADALLAGRMMEGRVTVVPDTGPAVTEVAAAGQVIVAVASAGFGPGVAVCVQVRVAVLAATCGSQDRPIANGAATVE